MGDGSGTFIRIEEPTILQSGTVICVGESHIIVGLIFDNLCENKDLRQSNQVSIKAPYLDQVMYNNEVVSTQIMLKFIRGPRIKETIKFMPDDAPILIGRNFNCHIQVASDESISRYQARIDHIDDKWILKDGNGESTKPQFEEKDVLENNNLIKEPANSIKNKQSQSII